MKGALTTNARVRGLSVTECRLLAELRRNEKLKRHFRSNAATLWLLQRDIDQGACALITGENMERHIERLQGNRYTPPSKCFPHVQAG